MWIIDTVERAVIGSHLLSRRLVLATAGVAVGAALSIAATTPSRFLGPDTRPALSPALVAATLRKAMAVTEQAGKDKLLTPPNLRKLITDTNAARKLWHNVRSMLKQCRDHRIALAPDQVEQAEIGYVLFLKRFGPLGLAQAVDRLVAISRRFPRPNFRLDAVISWFADEAWIQHRRGYIQRIQVNGKFTKPEPTGGGLREQALAHKYYRIALRYALRTARINSNDPNVGWLLWSVPLPPAYKHLSIWGESLFLARHKEARWWCYEELYSPGNLSNLLENVRLNLKVLAPETLASIQTGNWKYQQPHIPSWSEVSKALEKRNAKR